MRHSATDRWRVMLQAMLASILVLGIAGCGGSTARKSPSEGLGTADRIRLAQSYFKAGRSSEALEVLTEAMEKDPENAGLHNYYGQLCLLTGRNELAVKALREALSIDPYLTDAHNNLGIVYDAMGRKADAEAEYKEALKDPSYPTPEKVYLNLGVLYRSQERIDLAVGMLRKAVEIDPKFYQAHYELASTLEATGKLQEAAREFEVAAPGYRNHGPFHYRLGFTYMRLGEKSLAREHLSRVVEISPGSESAAEAQELLKMLN